MQRIILFMVVILLLASTFIGCDILFPGTPVTCVAGTDETILTIDWSNGTTVSTDVCTISEINSSKAIFLAVKNDLTNITVEKTGSLGTEFDNTIYNTVRGAFGTESDIDSNGKVFIVLYGQFSIGEQLRGYTNTGDLNGTTGNEGEYMYIDVKNFDTGVIKSTMAHEFQHIINMSIQISQGNNNGMEVWLDEGLAMAAEHLVYGSNQVKERIDKFNSDDMGNIKNGNKALIVWTEDNDVSSNYALSYLFVQWIRSQSSSDSVYQLIINNSSGSALSIVNATGESFENLLKGWSTDNLVDGNYGGRLATSVIPQEPSSVPDKIRPSAILYKPDACPSCSINGAGTNIRMVGINNNGTETPIATADKSFVFNINPNSNGSAESIGDWVVKKGKGGQQKPIKHYTEEEIKLMNSYSAIFKPKN